MRANKSYLEQLFQALDVNPKREVISLVGGGGKTSTMYRLVKELSHIGKRVLFTTTTHIKSPDFPMISYPSQLTEKIKEQIEDTMNHQPAFVGKNRIAGGKIKGISTDQVEVLNRELSFDYLIIEADGAKQKPLTAPEEYEPQVPTSTSLFIPIIGYDALGKKLNQENVHRPELISQIIKKPINSIITHEDIIALLKAPFGLMKGKPPTARASLILNKVSVEEINQASQLAIEILRKISSIDSVICGEIKTNQKLLLFS